MNDKLKLVLDTIDDDTRRIIAEVNAKAKEESPYGTLTVFRQFIPRLNAVEYTVFFMCHSDRMRIDLSINEEDLEKNPSSTYIKDKIYAMIEEHQQECQLKSNL